MAHIYEELPQEFLEEFDDVEPSRINYEEMLASVAASDFPHVYLKLESVFDIVATALLLHKYSRMDEDFILHYLEHGGRNVGIGDINMIPDLLDDLHLVGCDVSLNVVHRVHLTMN